MAAGLISNIAVTLFYLFFLIPKKAENTLNWHEECLLLVFNTELVACCNSFKTEQKPRARGKLLRYNRNELEELTRVVGNFSLSDDKQLEKI